MVRARLRLPSPTRAARVGASVTCAALLLTSAATSAARADGISRLASGPTGPATLPPLPSPDDAARRGAVAFDADVLPPPPTAPPTVVTVAVLVTAVVSIPATPRAGATAPRREGTTGSVARAVVVRPPSASLPPASTRPAPSATAATTPTKTSPTIGGSVGTRSGHLAPTPALRALRRLLVRLARISAA